MLLTVNSIFRLHCPKRVQNRVRKLVFSRSLIKRIPLCSNGIFHQRKRRLQKRILRHSNGVTRMIRHPAIDSETDPEMEPTNTLENSFRQTPSLKSKELPSSPNELLQLVKSRDFRKGQEDQRKRIQESYKLLDRNPWDETTIKFYVLALEDPVSDSPQIYTIRTRIEQKSTSEKLKRLFRGDSYKGEFIRVDHMTDGVITFIDYDNVERFRSLLEAEDARQVSIYEVSSQQLFQMTLQSKAVVVLMQCEDYVPSIHELTTSLRAQRSLETL